MPSTDKLKISLQEILSATNGFAEANIIGRGGYGVVYRGQSEQHGTLAIKRLNRGLGQGDHEYGMEVHLLSKYKHENLVSLVGFCGESDEKILVYKYEANQSLDKFLRSKTLSWMRRLRICVGAARGLRYLHNENEIGSGHGVVHRDIKCSNILLDENWNPKISDFGLSKIALTNSADSIMFSAACGTLGYVDPQILYGCGITLKSDVYSFGVVLFEVLFGKLVAIPAHLVDGRFTVNMVEKHYEEKTLDKLIDPDLRNEMDPDSLSTFSTIAYQCLKKRTEDRPTISLVVEALEKALGYQQVANTRSKSFGQQPSSSGFLYDVYVSFGVQNPEADIVDYLYDALERKGPSIYKVNIRSFDKESVLLSSIKQSRSFIIIFSENFGANSWNLYEVAAIMRSVKKIQRLVIPVYCGVQRSDVIKQKGDFGKAMSIYDSDARIGEWRDALVEAANAPGLKFSGRNPESFANEAAQIIKLNYQENGRSWTEGEIYNHRSYT